MEEATQVKPTEVKKPRAFVGAENSDLFDFSDMKIVTGGSESIPKAISKENSMEKPIKKINEAK
jgi:hypothetical protein